MNNLLGFSINILNKQHTILLWSYTDVFVLTQANMKNIIVYCGLYKYYTLVCLDNIATIL